MDTGGPEAARPFIEKAQPEHPSLIDAGHVLGELLGFVNVPQAPVEAIIALSSAPPLLA